MQLAPRRRLTLPVVLTVLAVAGCSASASDPVGPSDSGADAAVRFQALTASDTAAVEGVVTDYADALESGDCVGAARLFAADKQVLKCGEAQVSDTHITNVHDLAGTSGVYGKVPSGSHMVVVAITHHAKDASAGSLPDVWSYVVARQGSGSWRIYDEGNG